LGNLVELFVGFQGIFGILEVEVGKGFEFGQVGVAGLFFEEFVGYGYGLAIKASLEVGLSEGIP
jgi:hypothetical protein